MAVQAKKVLRRKPAAKPVKPVVKPAAKPVKPVVKPVAKPVKPVVKPVATPVVKPVVKPVATPVVKPELTEVKQHRKVNEKPALATKAGINISPAKVKNIVSNFVLNRDAHKALVELKKASPRDLHENSEDSSKVTGKFEGTPINQLSQETQDYIKKATSSYEDNIKDVFAHKFIKSMTKPVKTQYSNELHDAMESHESNFTKEFFDSENTPFDIHAFNESFDSKFYEEYNKDKTTRDADSSTDQWKSAINCVTKLKNRFSTNARVFLSTFAELVVNQLARNGSISCVADKKRIIQLNHGLDTTKDGFSERFSMYPLIANLETFKQAHTYIEQEKNTEHKKGEKGTPRNTDIFKLDWLELSEQYSFRFYIAETCREVRMELAKTLDDDGKENEVYNYTSVGKIFKNFCSTLVCELLMKLGRMLEKEIETRGIKTVNNTIIGAVISHYHIVCGVDEGPTFDFIRQATAKYYKYIDERHESRKSD